MAMPSKIDLGWTTTKAIQSLSLRRNPKNLGEAVASPNREKMATPSSIYNGVTG